MKNKKEERYSPGSMYYPVKKELVALIKLVNSFPISCSIRIALSVDMSEADMEKATQILAETAKHVLS